MDPLRIALLFETITLRATNAMATSRLPLKFEGDRLRQFVEFRHADITAIRKACNAIEKELLKQGKDSDL